MPEKNYSDTALALLKSGLGFYNTNIPEDVENYLKHLLNYAYDALFQIGVYLQLGRILDDQLQSMYAQWLYRHGAQGQAMPPMLRLAIREWQLASALEAARSEEIE